MSLLEVRDIHTYYGDSHVLQGLSLTAEKGKLIAILGRNGAGKSTLLRSIIGFTPPREGTIRFDGKEITGLSPYRIVKAGIGLYRRAAAFSPPLPSGNTWISLPGKGGMDRAGARMTSSRFSPSAGTRPGPGQDIERRRAADAGHRPSPCREPSTSHDGRTHRGTCTDHGPRSPADRQGDQSA